VRVESASVLVSDQEQAKRFYVHTLGFDLLVDHTWREGMRWSEVAPKRSATSLMMVTWSAGMLPGMYRVIVLAADDIQAIHQELVSRGIAFELPPTKTPRGTQAMFRDPDGNALMPCEHAVGHTENVPTEEPGLGLVEGVRIIMRPEEAQVGKRVRVRMDYRRTNLRGKKGTIANRWSNPYFTALDVLLDDGTWQLFWYYGL
jgi:catechol 2,3-dioxygenase-like lactoylglutathione lyase family enzyme